MFEKGRVLVLAGRSLSHNASNRDIFPLTHGRCAFWELYQPTRITGLVLECCPNVHVRGYTAIARSFVNLVALNLRGTDLGGRKG